MTAWFKQRVQWFLFVVLAGYTVSACAPERSVASPITATATQQAYSDSSSMSYNEDDDDEYTTVTGLQWTAPVTEAVWTATIDSTGGHIIAGNADLVVPARAVTTPTVFTIKRVAGRLVAFEFSPHGVIFAQPLVFTVDVSGTNFASFVEPKVRGAYFPLSHLLDQARGTGKVSEFRSLLQTNDPNKVRFTIDHFSGYMVSMD